MRKNDFHIENSPALQGDGALGLNARICRRDFLNSALLASGDILLKSLTPIQLLGQQPSWGGYSGVGDYASAAGNTEAVMLAGHAVRDGVFDTPSAGAIDTGEVFDLVIVGGGISGLAAALFFKDKTPSKRTCLVLETTPYSAARRGATNSLSTVTVSWRRKVRTGSRFRLRLNSSMSALE